MVVSRFCVAVDWRVRCLLVVRLALWSVAVRSVSCLLSSWLVCVWFAGAAALLLSSCVCVLDLLCRVGAASRGWLVCWVCSVVPVRSVPVILAALFPGVFVPSASSGFPLWVVGGVVGRVGAEGPPMALCSCVWLTDVLCAEM